MRRPGSSMQGFFEQGVLVLDWRLIARRYMRTWFLPDVVAVFPWEVAASERQTFTSARARKHSACLSGS